MNLSSTCVLVLLAISLPSASFAADSASKPGNDEKVNESAMSFRKASILNEVHHTHKMEEQLSGLGASQADNAAIKSMSAGMVKDHEAADTKLEALAQKESVVLGSFSANDAEQGALDLLGKMRGAEFDVAYLDFQRVTHKALDGKLSIWIGEEKDPAMKEYLKTIQKTVEHHEKMSGDLEKKSKFSKLGMN